MSKINNFNSIEDFHSFLLSTAVIELGSGSEGTCLLGNDGVVYKDLTTGFYKENYDVGSIITSDEVSSDFFVFPDSLFVVNNDLVGYTSRLINSDDFDFNLLKFQGIHHIDFEKVKKAYPAFLNDAINLGNQGIEIFDLPYNLMFDGENLYGIDTCGYSKENKDTVRENMESVDQAIKELFFNYFQTVYGHTLNRDCDVVSFLSMVEKIKNTQFDSDDGAFQYKKNTRN